VKTTPDVQRVLGRRIRLLREDHRLSQQQLADQLHLSQRYISELERGTKTPSLDTLVRIAHVGFQIPIAELFYDVDDIRDPIWDK
ncbi:MAG TPA: helix-turn-helix transcriptional regulator, partial [Kofleriaceae bacterium]